MLNWILARDIRHQVSEQCLLLLPHLSSHMNKVGRQLFTTHSRYSFKPLFYMGPVTFHILSVYTSNQVNDCRVDENIWQLCHRIVSPPLIRINDDGTWAYMKDWEQPLCISSETSSTYPMDTLEDVSTKPKIHCSLLGARS